MSRHQGTESPGRFINQETKSSRIYSSFYQRTFSRVVPPTSREMAELNIALRQDPGTHRAKKAGAIHELFLRLVGFMKTIWTK